MMVPLMRYTQFSGCASRSEYWWFQLFMMMFTVPLNVLGFIAGHTTPHHWRWFRPG